MIYFDMGATSMPKPDSVIRAMARAARACANPGRGGHAPSLRAAETVFECREAVADFFHTGDPSRVIFTSNCTSALNMAIKGIVPAGGHVVTSGYEHNSVIRPLEKLREKGVSYSIAASPLFCPEEAIRAFRREITKNTCCVVCTQVSNVFGYRLPVEEIDKLCAEKGIPLVIDAAQSAGSMEIDLSACRAPVLLCAPGHKGLLGPQGTGILIVGKDISLDTIFEGGTGSNSLEKEQPDFYPDRLESGTVNVPGIAGLREGIRQVAAMGPERIGAHERAITEKIAKGLQRMGGIQVFYPEKGEQSTGVLSFRCGKSAETMAEEYARKGICVRAGLHCAPVAHRTAGTLDTGTVRISPSWKATEAQAEHFLAVTRTLLS